MFHFDQDPPPPSLLSYEKKDLYYCWRHTPYTRMQDVIPRDSYISKIVAGGLNHVVPPLPHSIVTQLLHIAKLYPFPCFMFSKYIQLFWRQTNLLSKLWPKRYYNVKLYQHCLSWNDRVIYPFCLHFDQSFGKSYGSLQDTGNIGKSWLCTRAFSYSFGNMARSAWIGNFTAFCSNFYFNF